MTAVASAVVLTLTVGAGATPTYIDLTGGTSSATVNGAVLLRGVGPGGTGNFDPFLTLSTNAPTEAGWNSDSAPAGDAFYGGSRTHAILAAAVPPQSYEGALYREITLDANDQGSDDYMSVDAIKLFLDDQAGLKGYDNGTQTFANDNASPASLIWSLGNNAILLRTQYYSSGSGEWDLTVLVPNSIFPSECYYGSTTCNKYLVLYNANGGAGIVDGHNYDATAGFEEWRTRLLPVVNVAKTATPSYKLNYDWTVKKEVSLDNSTWQDDSVELNLFNGQSHTVYWRITPTRDAGTAAGWKVAGSVTVTNPTGGSVIGTKISATIDSLTDVIQRTGLADVDVTLSCPVSFPYTLAGGDSLTCTYTQPLTSATNGTNQATALLSTGSSYTGSAAFDFSGVTPGAGDDATASLSDTEKGSLGAATSGTAATYQTTESCGSSETIENTATLTETDSATTRTDDASVVKTCDGLTVEKTATPSFTRTYGWTVKKYVSLTGLAGSWQDASVSFNQFVGDARTVYWKVVPTRDAGTDSAWKVTGTITISNDAPMDATGVSVADTIAGVATGATVDCDPGTAGNQTTVTVPADGSATCSYSSDLPDATTRLNTAKATLAGVDYTGTKSVDFTGVSPTEVNATATLSDTHEGSLGAATSGTAVTYSTEEECGLSRTITNTATVTYGSSTATDDAAAIVGCRQLTVVKTATPTFTRTWTWTVDKTADDSALTLAVGEVFFEPYTVTYGATSADSAFNVSGTITVTSPADAPTRSVDVSDLYGGSAATVDCNGALAGDGLPVDMAGGDSLSCTYSIDLAGATNGSNVATATLSNSPSGTTDFQSNSASVAFGDPTTVIDESIAASDTVPAGSYCTGANTPVAGCTAAMVGTGPPSGTVTATTSPFTKVFTYTRIIGPYASGECGSQNVDNTASLTTNDTSTTLSDPYRIVVTIPCPSGCTLTQGYWKTHSNRGPAPFDDTWNLIPAVGPYAAYAPVSLGTAENLMFFYSGQTWYQVFWTPPKGGNAYYVLAHQYEAAVLNILNGADPSAIMTTLEAARVQLAAAANTPQHIGSLKGSDATRALWISLAGTLGSYNEGTIGPGHCSEDMTHSTSP